MSVPGIFDYYRRQGILPALDVKTSFLYFRRGEPAKSAGNSGARSMNLAGACGLLVYRNVSTSGGAVFGSSAIVSYYSSANTTGGMVLGNSAPSKPVKTHIGTGGVVSGGISNYKLNFVRLAGGNCVISNPFTSMMWTYIAHYGVLGQSAFRVSGGTANVKSTKWNYISHYGILGNSCLKFRDSTADVVSSEWNYLAHYGYLGQSVLNIPENSFGVLSSYHSYLAHHGNLGQSCLRVTDSTVDVRGSYYRYIAHYGILGNSCLKVTGGTASIVAPKWVYSTAGGSINTGNFVNAIVYRSNYLSGGGLRLGSFSPKIFKQYFESSGGAVTGGNSTYGKFLPNVIASGGGVLSGTADLVVGSISVIASGGMNTDGEASLSYAAVASGLMLFSGACDAACSYFNYVARISKVNLYTPSYYEIIDQQSPIGLWVKKDSVSTVLSNFGSLGTAADADVNGSVSFNQQTLIPNEKDGYSMRFDYINTYALVRDSFNNNTLNFRSVSVVITIDDFTSRSCIYDEGNTVNGLNLYANNGFLVCHFWNINPPTLESVSVKTPISLNITYHATFVFDGNNKLLKLYLNGNLVGSASTTLQSLPPRNYVSFGAKYSGTRYNDTGIGYASSTSSSGTGHWVRGNIQAVSVWDRVLTDREVSAQYGAMSSRYSLTQNYQLSGNLTAANQSDVAFSSWTYQASGGQVVSGSSGYSFSINSSFAHQASGQLNTFISAGYGKSLYLYDAEGSIQLSADFAAIELLPVSASESLVLRGSAGVLSSYYTYQALGGLMVGAFARYDVVASGGMRLGNTAGVSYSVNYSASGCLRLNPFFKVDYAIELEREISWNISKGILRYYRVESKPRPYVCPPFGGKVCREDQCVTYIVNVTARSLHDLCDQLRKLRLKGPVKRIQIFSRPVLKADEIPGIDYDCNTVTDVNIPDCGDLFLDYDLQVDVGVGIYNIENEGFAYVVSGGIRSGGVSGVTHSQWDYVAGGNMQTTSTATYNYPGLVIIAASGKFNLGGTADSISSSLGELLVSAGIGTEILATTATFGLQSAGTLTPPNVVVDSNCCGNLPSLLYMSHQITRFAKFSDFLAINDLSIRTNINLVYKARRNIWHNNLHLSGVGINNDLESWDFTSEFGCMNDLDGIPTPDSLWGFSFLVVNKNLRTRVDNYSKIVLGFDPVLICNTNQILDSTLAINVKTKVASPVVLRTVILYDEIGLFKNRNFINDPSVKFRVSSAPVAAPITNVSLSNNLQELLA